MNVCKVVHVSAGSEWLRECAASRLSLCIGRAGSAAAAKDRVPKHGQLSTHGHTDAMRRCSREGDKVPKDRHGVARGDAPRASLIAPRRHPAFIREGGGGGLLGVRSSPSRLFPILRMSLPLNMPTLDVYLDGDFLLLLRRFVRFRGTVFGREGD